MSKACCIFEGEALIGTEENYLYYINLLDENVHMYVTSKITNHCFVLSANECILHYLTRLSIILHPL